MKNNLPVEMRVRVQDGEIRIKFAFNVVQQRKFSDLLSNVIARYQNRSIETAQAMEEHEVCLCDALSNNALDMKVPADETLNFVARGLTENLR